MEGWLTKKGGRIATWRRRWCVLTPDRLEYFTDQDKKTQKGYIDMSEVLEVGHILHETREWCVAIRTEKRLYVASCDDEQSFNKWIDALHELQPKELDSEFTNVPHSSLGNLEKMLFGTKKKDKIKEKKRDETVTVRKSDDSPRETAPGSGSNPGLNSSNPGVTSTTTVTTNNPAISSNPSTYSLMPLPTSFEDATLSPTNRPSETPPASGSLASSSISTSDTDKKRDSSQATPNIQADFNGLAAEMKELQNSFEQSQIDKTDSFAPLDKVCVTNDAPNFDDISQTFNPMLKADPIDIDTASPFADTPTAPMAIAIPELKPIIGLTASSDEFSFEVAQPAELTPK